MLPPFDWRGPKCALQEVQQGQLLLYGGVGADKKPLHDAWLLDINAQQWTCLYSAAADAVSQVGWMWESAGSA